MHLIFGTEMVHKYTYTLYVKYSLQVKNIKMLKLPTVCLTYNKSGLKCPHSIKFPAQEVRVTQYQNFPI